MAYTAIDDPSAYFKVQLYTGDGSVDHAITFDDTDTDMQPDMRWIKSRSAAENHYIADSVRGDSGAASGYYRLNPNTNAAEYGGAGNEYVGAIGSDGFTVGSNDQVNTNTETYVSWNWKGGTTSGIATDGNETLTIGGYSFNQTSGFSIIKYTGTTGATDKFSHGLGVVPQMIIIKSLAGATDWLVYHHQNTAAPETEWLLLNGTDATSDDATMWYDTAPTAYNVTLGTGSQGNAASSYIAYCFAEKQGYSKFGSYEGNGDADGTFVYTGFRPAFVMCKSIDSTSSWHMFDNKREGYNVDNDALVTEDTTVEATTDMIYLLSNGFKLRITTDPNVAETYIYMAFAEAPFVNSNGVPCNAR